MSARVLVVDDIEANVRLLQAKLEVEYYEVLTASGGAQAMELAGLEQPDIILLDVMMPEMDGFEVCRRLKANVITQHIPVVLVTALDGRRDRLTGLEAGADDFLTKPIDDVALFARVRSLTRLKQVIDELRHREASGRRLGVIEGEAVSLPATGARVVVADDVEHQAHRIVTELAQDQRPVVEADPVKALAAARARADLLIINAASKGFDGLRLAAQVRADEATRHLPILAIVEPDDRHRAGKALELGVNDILHRPIDPEELAARVKTLVRQKRYTDVLRNTLDNSLELAVTDTLTGLHNRRYMTTHAGPMIQHAMGGGGPVSALMVDIDHFKRINDTFGHDVGDEVLKEFAVRLATNVRGIDLACRTGGEEFVVLMPETRLQDALRIAERLRQHVAGTPVRVANLADPLAVTISVGVACTEGRTDDTPESLLKRADECVYEAKTHGRNQVVSRAA
jgi:two-component system cell cycle response regulator